MTSTTQRVLRILRRLVSAGVFLVVLGAAAIHWSDRLSPAIQTACRIAGLETARAATEGEASDLERSQAVQKQLRDRLVALQAERRDIADQLRMLQAGSTLAVTQGREDGEETRNVACRAKAANTPDSSPRSNPGSNPRGSCSHVWIGWFGNFSWTPPSSGPSVTPCRAAGLPWSYDPGRSGPNAVVPAAEWESEIATANP